ncbi:MAG: restriction endonuclease [Chloroflexota bacterium]|jgi:type II restriction enzyme|nr:restriction endonuclease [Chloroflexota bacterium]
MSDPDRLPEKVAQARQALKDLGFDGDRSNERSALVLLALLGLTPNSDWSEATNPMLRTVEIMEAIRIHFGKDYAPNSRETIRQFTLHQFIDAMLVVQNPDQPDRPINSPNWCYQVTSRALELLRTIEDSGFDQRLNAHMIEVPGLREQYAKARLLNRIPVTLPNGQPVTLSPGGQNVLLKQMIEDFCAMYTPGGTVLYVGDAEDKYVVFEEDALRELGVTLEHRGKMPDLIVYLNNRNWMVLLEAASTHGPIDASRHAELSELFRNSSAAPVYVSCFPSREVMRRYLPLIAWETDVWCADNPTHLIHFNGERFLGPYAS